MNGLHLRVTWLMVFLAMAIVAAAPPVIPAAAVRLDPADPQPRTGNLFTLALRVENVTALNHVDLWLNYDPAALEVQDAVPLTFGTQIAPGSFLQPDHVRANLVENGLIHYSVEQLWPHPPVSGSGVVATIAFRVLQPGETTVVFDYAASFLFDESGTALPVAEWGDASIFGRPAVTLAGAVARQGWPDHERTSMWTVIMAGPGQFPVASRAICTERSGAFRLDIPDDFTRPGAQTIQPNKFTPVNCPGSELNPYQTAFVRAAFPNYLSAEGWVCLSDGVTDLGSVTLPGGDVNGDAAINISDVTQIISHFGKTTPTPCAVAVFGCPIARPAAPPADVNGDCRVNIRDVVLAVSNFGRSGPLPLNLTTGSGP